MISFRVCSFCVLLNPWGALHLLFPLNLDAIGEKMLFSSSSQWKCVGKDCVLVWHECKCAYIRWVLHYLCGLWSCRELNEEERMGDLCTEKAAIRKMNVIPPEWLTAGLNALKGSKVITENEIVIKEKGFKCVESVVLSEILLVDFICWIFTTKARLWRNFQRKVMPSCSCLFYFYVCSLIFFNKNISP